MWYMLSLLFGVIICVLLCVQAHRIYLGYQKAQGTKWQRFLAAFSDSLTIVWARFVQFIGAIGAFVAWALPQLDPSTTLGATIQQLFTPDKAKYWLVGIMGLGALFEFVRRRPGSIDPITPPAQDKP